jgi:GntR family transcriptional repressor for pyruvate dehydrogenase complex
MAAAPRRSAEHEGAPRSRIRRSEKVSESIARDIVRSIVEQDLAPGSVLPSEATMLEDYQVGRGSLREALRLLEVQGLIAIKPGPGGGPVVGLSDSGHFGRMATMYFQLSGATFADLLEARAALEPMMVRGISEQQDPDAMAALQELYSEKVSFDNDADYARVTAGFHHMITSCSKNPVLNLLSSAIGRIYADRIPGSTYPKDRRPGIIEDHRRIMQAMIWNQPEQAEKLMRSHMVHMGEDMRMRYPGLLEERVSWY